MAKGRSFPLTMSAKSSFSIDDGVNYDMGKLYCALTMHHGERVMNDDFDDDELPVDYIFRPIPELNGPEFYTVIRKIVDRVVPDYTLLDIIVEDSEPHFGVEGRAVFISFAELEDRQTFLLQE